MRVYFTDRLGNDRRFFDIVEKVDIDVTEDESKFGKIRRWLEENGQGTALLRHYISVKYRSMVEVGFENAADAVLFKLVWSGQ